MFSILLQFSAVSKSGPHSRRKTPYCLPTASSRIVDSHTNQIRPSRRLLPAVGSGLRHVVSGLLQLSVYGLLLAILILIPDDLADSVLDRLPRPRPWEYEGNCPTPRVPQSRCNACEMAPAIRHRGPQRPSRRMGRRRDRSAKGNIRGLLARVGNPSRFRVRRQPAGVGSAIS